MRGWRARSVLRRRRRRRERGRGGGCAHATVKRVSIFVFGGPPVCRAHTDDGARATEWSSCVRRVVRRMCVRERRERGGRGFSGGEAAVSNTHVGFCGLAERRRRSRFDRASSASSMSRESRQPSTTTTTYSFVDTSPDSVPLCKQRERPSSLGLVSARVPKSALCTTRLPSPSSFDQPRPARL